MLLTDIHVRAFTGPSLKTYLHTVAKLRSDVFRDYPYLAEPDLLRETNFLRRIASSKESIGVLIFDNTTLVGASFGMPLALVDEVQKPFLDRHLNLNDYYLFTESVLLKPYRSRGIGHHFFDVREAHVQHLKKYTHICFCTPVKPENDPLRPEDDIPLNDFWRKRGYVQHPELFCRLQWKLIGQHKPSEQIMTFWMKEIH